MKFSFCETPNLALLKFAKFNQTTILSHFLRNPNFAFLRDLYAN
ncbi:hypothetical protein OFO12_07795 [Campylobacter sp. JMF_04 NA10]|nr:hypothetical protein [Campylobacter sp. JMF_04 NA10]MDA3077258.1 hypothetical protein [Campylobacter sp. JMF_04 NA10]